LAASKVSVITVTDDAAIAIIDEEWTARWCRRIGYLIDRTERSPSEVDLTVELEYLSV
jgi:hypothetical protein